MEREGIQFINIERIAWSCDDYGITPRQLADATGIADGTMDGLMSGDDGLTFRQLIPIPSDGDIDSTAHPEALQGRCQSRRHQTDLVLDPGP